MSADNLVERSVPDNQLLMAKLIAQKGSLSLTDLTSSLAEQGKSWDISYVSREVNKLVDAGYVQTNMEGNKKIVSLVDGVVVGETALQVPSTYGMGSDDRLSQALELFNIKGDVKRRILSLVQQNPGWGNPYSFYSMLLTLKIEPNTAKLLSEHFFGSQAYAQQQMSMGPNIAMGYPNGSNWGASPMNWGGQQGVVLPFGQNGPAVMSGPNGQPIIVQPPAPPAPASVPVIQSSAPAPVPMRKVRRPLKNPDGTFVKDGMNYVWEEVEEPVASSSNNDSFTQWMMQQESRDRADRDAREAREKADKDARDRREKAEKEERDKERQWQDKIERERREADQKREQDRRDYEERMRKLELDSQAKVEAARSESEKARAELVTKQLSDQNDQITGLYNSIKERDDKNQKWFAEQLTRQNERATAAQENALLRQQIATGTTAGERPMVSILKDTNRLLREAPDNFASAITRLPPQYRPPPPGTNIGPPMTPEQQLAAARQLQANQQQQNAQQIQQNAQQLQPQQQVA